jgi:hypothetical protein
MKKKEKKNGYGGAGTSKAASRPARKTMRVGGSRSATRSTSSPNRKVAPPTRGGRGGGR